MTNLTYPRTDEPIPDPSTLDGLRYNRTSWWYEMPSGPLPCPLCGKPQHWTLPVDRYLRVRPRRPAVRPLDDPQDVPDPASLVDDRQRAAARPPPGWGYLVCGYCSGQLVLVLRPLPGLPSPPVILELSAVMLNYSAVQYRLTDDPNTRRPRWRTALVTTQHDGVSVDLSVLLHPTDPEHRELIAASSRHVEYRLDDGPDGAQRWRLAMVADRLEDGRLDLTVHYSAEDQTTVGRAFDRRQASPGDGVGCWRPSATTFQTTLTVSRSRRGDAVGCWLPVSS